MKTADIKKGMRVRMDNGWYGTMKDNGRGTTRIVEVEGFYTETGSVYSHDIKMVLPHRSGVWVIIEHTAKELQLKEMTEKLFA
jgi:hypothetical protein